VKGWKNIYQAISPKTGRSSHNYIRQSRLQTNISQKIQIRPLHSNKGGNTLKGNNNFQPICTKHQCAKLHQTYNKGLKRIYKLQHSGDEIL
jgi:hypothetical protein